MVMKIAVMQPYLFPYIGYFQLMHAVDKFIVLDDVTYIRRGWINRNRILINHRASTFTVPLKQASQRLLIKDLEIAEQEGWREKLLKKIFLAYKKSPNFNSVYPLLERIILCPGRTLAAYIGHSLRELHGFMGLKTELVTASRQYRNQNLKGEERILDFCRQEQSSVYINAMGGTALYSVSRFAGAGVSLRFLRPRMIHYRQFGNEFVPWLSLIDILMFNTPGQVAHHLSEYDLTPGEIE